MGWRSQLPVLNWMLIFIKAAAKKKYDWKSTQFHFSVHPHHVMHQSLSFLNFQYEKISQRIEWDDIEINIHETKTMTNCKLFIIFFFRASSERSFQLFFSSSVDFEWVVGSLNNSFLCYVVYFKETTKKNFSFKIWAPVTTFKSSNDIGACHNININNRKTL